MGGMSSTPVPAARPAGRLKTFLFKAPVWLYRAHLGWMFGNRLMMVTHVGRKSGLVRRTVLEVVAYHEAAADRPNSPEWFVFAGYGPKSDWYRNLQANPPQRVDVGRRHFAATCRFPDDAERRELLTAYARQHPKTARVLGQRLFGEDFDVSPESVPRLAAAMPCVAFTPVRTLPD